MKSSPFRASLVVSSLVIMGVGVACSSSSGGSAGASTGVCSTPRAADCATDATGAALAAAYTEHVPTADEARYAAAFLTLLASASQNGTLSTTLYETDILERLAATSASYPSLFVSCSPLTSSRALRPSSASLLHGASALSSLPLRPAAVVDCNADCSANVGTGAIALAGDEALWQGVETVAAKVVGFGGLGATMSDALAAFLASGGKALTGAGAAATGAIPESEAEQIVHEFGVATDTANASASAAVLLGGGATAASVARVLGEVNVLVLFAQLNATILNGLSTYIACGTAHDENCSSGGPLDYCAMADCTLAPCAPPGTLDVGNCLDPVTPDCCSQVGAGQPPLADGGACNGSLCGGTTCCGAGSFCNIVGECLPSPPGGCTTLCGVTCCSSNQTCDQGSCSSSSSSGSSGSSSGSGSSGSSGGSGSSSGSGGGSSGGSSGSGSSGSGSSSGGNSACCACEFDVYCTVFGQGGCWRCQNSSYDASGACTAPYGYLTSPGVCACDPAAYQVCQ